MMAIIAPPGRRLYIPETEETPIEGLARYESIAQDAYEVAYDPAEKPVVNRAFTMSLLLSLSWHEGGWLKVVDLDAGEGRKRLSKKGWNDWGNSYCLCQINLGKKGNDSARKTAEGWTGMQLIADRKKCFRAALHIIQKTQCGGGPGMLNSYATGTCSKGLDLSRIRVGTAQRFYDRLRLVPPEGSEALAQKL